MNFDERRQHDVGRRLQEHRSSWRCPRSFLGKQAGVDDGVIKRIELGRTPLKYSLAVKLLKYLDANPIWLATGKGGARGYIEIPTAEALNEKENALFTDVFDKRLLDFLKATQVSETDLEQSDVHLRHVATVLLCGRIKTWFRTIPNEFVERLSEELTKHGQALVGSYPKDAPQKQLQRQALFDLLERTREQKASLSNPDSKTPLDDINLKVNITSVKPMLPQLLKRLKAATELRGQKAALAKYLDVLPQMVSQWLSGAKEPGGETTLRLLHWVEQQERKK